MSLAAPSVTIIGFGAFGRLLASLLARHAAVSVYDPSAAALQAAVALGLGQVARVEDLTADILILAVPIQALEGCLRDIAPHLRPGQMVVDVCSVKEEPARLMQQLLPGGVELLASHPMFGPQAARRGLAGCQVVLCPLRGGQWRRLAAFLRQLRFKVIVTSPEEHDRQAALTQGLTHLLAQAVSAIGQRPKIRTPSYDLIAEALGMVAGDAPEVFEAVTERNRHVAAVRESLLRTLALRGKLPAAGS